MKMQIIRISGGARGWPVIGYGYGCGGCFDTFIGDPLEWQCYTCNKKLIICQSQIRGYLARKLRKSLRAGRLTKACRSYKKN